MKNLNNNKYRKLTVLIVLISIIISYFPSFKVKADSHEGQVRVIVENTTFPVADGAAWEGTLIDTWMDLDDDSTMMSLVDNAINEAGYYSYGAENNYLENINGLEAFSGGDMSGWMGTLNDWFTSTGFADFTVENGTLTAGDEIRVLYTCNWGEDLGGSFSNNDKSIKSVVFNKGVLDKTFNPEVFEYVLTVPEDTTSLNVIPTASNKNYKVQISLLGNSYKRSDYIPVADGITIQIVCGDKSDSTMNDNSGEEYVYLFQIKYDKKEEINKSSAELSALTIANDSKFSASSILLENEEVSTSTKDIYFSSDKKEYNLSDIDNKKTELYFKAVPQNKEDSVTLYYGDDYTNSVNLIDNNEAVAISDLVKVGTNSFKIKVVPKDTDLYDESTYLFSLNCKEAESIELSIKTEPENAVSRVYDKEGNEIFKNEKGLFPGKFFSGGYTYEICCKGYVTKKGNVPTDTEQIEVSLDTTAINQLEMVSSEWKNFRNSDTNNGITNISLPTNNNEAKLQFSKKLGSGYTNAPSVSIIVDDSLIVLCADKIYKLDLLTGEIISQENMCASIQWGYTPPTYAEGIIFCPLRNGIIQAFNAKTLESLWIYQDPLKGQCLSPITYSDGIIYTGFFNGEKNNANYTAISIDDEDISQQSESKTYLWNYTNKGGFYWAGSVVTGEYIIFGSDNGSNTLDDSGHIFSFNKTTGEKMDSLEISGDQRSSITFYNGKIYFTTKAGYLYSAKIDLKTGKFKDLQSHNFNAQSTSTPVVYNGYIYLGVGTGINTSDAGNRIVMLEEASLKEIDSVSLRAYPQCSLLLSTAYESTDNALYLYTTYNSMPGSIGIVKVDFDKEASEYMSYEDIDLVEDLQQYCISSVICSKDGVMYYKNDSGNIIAFSNITNDNNYVEDIISSIGKVTIEKESLIISARNAYNRLSDNMKKKVNNYSTLQSAEQNIILLKNPAPTVDDNNEINDDENKDDVINDDVINDDVNKDDVNNDDVNNDNVNNDHNKEDVNNDVVNNDVVNNNIIIYDNIVTHNMIADNTVIENSLEKDKLFTEETSVESTGDFSTTSALEPQTDNQNFDDVDVSEIDNKAADRPALKSTKNKNHILIWIIPWIIAIMLLGLIGIIRFKKKKRK